MKTRSIVRKTKQIAQFLFGVLVLVLVNGCASNKADWNARLGAYTFDQAVADLGPPDRRADLSDGSIAADWLVRRGERGGYVTYFGPAYHRPYRYPYYYGPGAGTYYEPGSPEYWLGLVFGPDHRLSKWRQYTR